MKSAILAIISIQLLTSGCLGENPEAPGVPVRENLRDMPEPHMELETLTMAEVAEHDNPQSCWLVIEGNVYDVTEYARHHPGGNAILQGCGKDATQLFNNRPGTGTPHSQKARKQLPSYQIGEIKK